VPDGAAEIFPFTASIWCASTVVVPAPVLALVLSSADGPTVTLQPSTVTAPPLADTSLPIDTSPVTLPLSSPDTTVTAPAGPFASSLLPVVVVTPIPVTLTVPPPPFALLATSLPPRATAPLVELTATAPAVLIAIGVGTTGA
jgi:hypothetical protein